MSIHPGVFLLKKNFTSNLSVRGPLRVLCILKQNRGYPVEKFSEFFNLLKSSEFLVVSIANNNLVYQRITSHIIYILRPDLMFTEIT